MNGVPAGALRACHERRGALADLYLPPGDGGGKQRPQTMKKKLRTYNVVIERDADGWLVASVPALHGCHTQARSLDTLMERMREVIELCVLEAKDEESENEFVGVQRLAVAV